MRTILRLSHYRGCPEQLSENYCRRRGQCETLRTSSDAQDGNPHLLIVLEGLDSLMPLVYVDLTINPDILNLLSDNKVLQGVHDTFMMRKYYKLAVVLNECVHEVRDAGDFALPRESVGYHECVLVFLLPLDILLLF